MKSIVKTTFICMMLFLCCPSGKAQITVGSLNPPVQGALLDLKEHPTDADTTTCSKGGLLLPRVKLVSKTTLQPFIASATPADADKRDHIGLTVYNLTNNSGQSLSQGIYVWTGTDWKKTAYAVRTIQLPAFSLPWSTTDRTFDLFGEVYKKNFRPAAYTSYVSSIAANTPAPFPEFTDTPGEFDYALTGYDPAVIQINSVSSAGVVNYRYLGSVQPTTPVFITAIMMRK